jgi:hypothetical protein
LRIDRLVGVSIRHADRGAVDEFDVTSLPELSGGHAGFAAAGHLTDQPREERLRQFRPGTAIGAVVQGRRLEAQDRQQRANACDGSQAGALFPLEQRLRKKRPENQRRGVNGVFVVLRKADLLLGKCFEDLRLSENLSQGQGFLE